MKVRIIIFVLVVLSVILTGLWLKKSGKPYNKLLVTIHKLLSVSAIIIIITIVYTYGKESIFVQADILFIVLSVFLLTVALVSGAFLTIERLENNLMPITHKTSSLLAILSCIYTLYRIYLLIL